MIPRLNPQESTAAQAWVKQPRGEDVSPNGAFAVRPQGDSIVLSDRRSGTEQILPTPGYKLEATAVSDDGRTVAFLGKKEGECRTELVRVRDGRSEVLDSNILASHDLDLSADGSTIYAPSSFDIIKVDEQGKRQTLLKGITVLDRLEVLPSGRLLAEGSTNGWGGKSTPAFYVVDDVANTNALLDIEEAESLGASIREPLLTQYEAAYPGTPVEQRERLIDDFGYQTPTYRLPSPDRNHMVFEFQPRLSPSEDKVGVYALTRGQGTAVRLTEPGDSSGLGSHRLNAAEWSSRSTRVAMVFTSDLDAPRAAVAKSDGSGFKALPGHLAGEPKERVLAWSGEERYLGYEVHDGDRVHVYCYDSQSDQVFPVIADVRLAGWDGDKMRIRLANGAETSIPAVPMNLDEGFGVITGNPSTAPKTPSVPIKVTDEYIEVGGVRVPRRHEETNH